ncbi:putative secreted protein with PEP-CTERM sorting signal [Prosthecobacter fusiformis]|uniref:Putative secreted protein with PEP-CTERM sorting signal n=1 Tax=Prosthecobacter fusiformis TaxID=48464 RepID=A0A4R7S1P5_9BACT|nr:autotransporter-associated beta strand repeat-containing protein [Prosthecobacter fusiformis]TDU71135.1 putative secreted protein with PEP-CTERM sorting signal [Prosthecobacter fusiformis]
MAHLILHHACLRSALHLIKKCPASLLTLALLQSPLEAASLWWDALPSTANGASNAGTGGWFTTGTWDKGSDNGYQTWVDNNDAIINGTSTVQINANVIANTLSVTGNVNLQALNATPVIPVFTLTNGGSIANNATMNFGGNATTAGAALDVRLGGDINTSVTGTRGTLTLSAGSTISSNLTGTTRTIYANVSLGNGPGSFLGTFGNVDLPGTIAISGNMGSGGGTTRIFGIASGTTVEVAGNYTSLSAGASGTGGLRVQGGGTLKVNGMTTGANPAPNLGNFIVGTGTDATTLELTCNGVMTSANSDNTPGIVGTMASNITIGSANSTFRVNSTFSGSATAGVQTMSGVISGTGKLVQQGAGTLALTNTNTYTGTTTVSGGVLQVGRAGAGSTGTGSVTVETGGTILGTGIVRGSSFTAQSGSIIHAGDGLATTDFGSLRFTPSSGSGSFNFAAGSSTLLGLNPGGSGDLLSFDGLSGGTLTFNGNLTITAPGYVPTSEETFNLLDWANLTTTFASRYASSSYSDFLLGNGDDNLGFDLPNIAGSGYGWDISQFITNGTISTVFIIPEPGRTSLIFGGVFGLWMRRRRPVA